MGKIGTRLTNYKSDVLFWNSAYHV